MQFSLKLTLLSLALLLTAFSTNAQSKWQQQKAQEKTDELTTALELDEATAEKVQEIHLAAFVKQKTITDQVKAEELTKEESKPQYKKIRKETAAQIEAILDEETTEKYRAYRKPSKKGAKKMKKELKEQKPVKKEMAKKEKINKGKSKADWQAKKAQEATNELAVALELDEATKAKVYDIQLATFLKQKAINNQMKAGELTKEESKMQAKAARKAAVKEVEAMLNAEKKEAYRLYHKAQRQQKKK